MEPRPAEKRPGKLDRLLLMAARLWRLLCRFRMPAALLAASLMRWMGVSREGSSARGRDWIPKRIVVIRLDGMGDVVMSTPLFRELKLAFRECHVTAVVQQRNRELLETNPYVDRVLSPQPIGALRLLQSSRTALAILWFYLSWIRSESFDIALHPRLGPDYYGADLLLALVDAPLTIRYRQARANFLVDRIARFAFRRAVNLPRPAPQHEVLSTLALLEQVTGRCPPSAPQLYPTYADREDAAALLSGGRAGSIHLYIGFGAMARRRQWPLERWAAAIRLIAARHSVVVMVLCTEADAVRGEKLRAMLSVPSRLVAGVPLRILAVMLEQGHLFLGPDSGLAHLAAAAGCPCVVVSPHSRQGDPGHENSPLRFSPWSEMARVVRPESGLEHCEPGCSGIKPHCILQVSPEQVAAAAEDLLRVGRKGVQAARQRGPAILPQTSVRQAALSEKPGGG